MTKKFIGVIVVLIILFDIYLYLLHPDTTISGTMATWNATFPFVSMFFSYLCGVLSGHFFWPQKRGAGGFY